MAMRLLPFREYLDYLSSMAVSLTLRYVDVKDDRY